MIGPNQERPTSPKQASILRGIACLAHLLTNASSKLLLREALAIF